MKIVCKVYEQIFVGLYLIRLYANKEEHRKKFG